MIEIDNIPTGKNLKPMVLVFIKFLQLRNNMSAIKVQLIFAIVLL